MKQWRRFYRAIYRINHALTTARAWSSGNPRRVAKLYERRAAYKLFNRMTRRLFR